MTQHDATRRNDTAAVAALAELVRLKDGPRGSAYERDKPLAWEAAREVLDGRGLDVEGLYSDAVNLAADRSPFGHPLPESEIRAARAGVDAALTAVGASQTRQMHQFWETTDDVGALRTALREQSHMVRALSERNTELVRAAAAGHERSIDQAAPVCVWCESLASGTAEHNDGVRYPSCAEHGLPGTYTAGGAL
jgi:hypothetical protein